jgi:hypothetical protein
MQNEVDEASLLLVWVYPAMLDVPDAPAGGRNGLVNCMLNRDL